LAFCTVLADTFEDTSKLKETLQERKAQKASEEHQQYLALC